MSQPANAIRKTVGFVGYGAMAVRMGANLRRAGYEIVAYVPSGKTSATETTLLATPRDVALQSDYIIACVPDDAALAQSAYDDDGILAGMTSGKLLLNTSTVSPKAADALADAGKQRSLRILDTPMSGSTPEAEKGELVMLVGGDHADLELARPVLEAVSKAIIHAGSSGAGARLKLAINGIMGATLNIIAEGVTYGLRAGIERDVLYDALGQLAVISPHHKRKLLAAQKGEFPPQFPTRLMSKDMGLLMDAGRSAGAFMPGMAVADQALALSNQRHANDDYGALIGAMEHSIVPHQDS